ncbi:hypothetical protein KBD71_01610 [Candidatus Woesebacteria bacterium]|nr:hypothetical protein [Candidatus Woesebacteria bacterium]
MAHTEYIETRKDHERQDPLLAEVTQVTSSEQLNDKSFVQELINQGRVLRCESGLRGWAADTTSVYTLTIFPIAQRHITTYAASNPLDGSIIDATVNGINYRSQLFIVSEDVGTWVERKLNWNRRLQPFREFATGVRDGLRTALRR